MKKLTLLSVASMTALMLVTSISYAADAEAPEPPTGHSFAWSDDGRHCVHTHPNGDDTWTGHHLCRKYVETKKPVSGSSGVMKAAKVKPIEGDDIGGGGPIEIDPVDPVGEVENVPVKCVGYSSDEAEEKNQGSLLKWGSKLYPGQQLYTYSYPTCGAADGAFYTFKHQTDGNLVLSKSGFRSPTRILWSSNTSGLKTTHLIMQYDGNLALYNGKSLIWQSRTSHLDEPSCPRKGGHAVLQPNGNFVVYDYFNKGEPLWSTDTAKGSQNNP